MDLNAFNFQIIDSKCGKKDGVDKKIRSKWAPKSIKK